DEGDIVVLRDEGETEGRPRAFDTAGARLAVEVSITHTAGVALAAASERRVGIDLVEDVALEPALLEEAFTAAEHTAWTRAIGDVRRAACLAFAAKEAALKWLGCGLRVPARSVWIEPHGTLPSGIDTHGPFVVTLHHDDATHTVQMWLGSIDALLWIMV